MYYKFSKSIFLSNVNLAFKTFLYSACIVVVVTAIGAGVLTPIFRPVQYAVAEAGLMEEASEKLNLFLSGELTISETVSSFGELAGDFASVLNQLNGIVVFGYFFVGFLLILIGFLRSTFDIATASVLNGFMSAKMRGGLLPEYFRHIAKSFGYAALKTVVSSLFSACIMLILGAFVLLTFEAISFLSVSIAIAGYVVLFSLKFTLFADWIPNILEGNRVGESLRRSVIPNGSRSGFKNKFLTALCFYSVMAVCVLAFSIPTFGLVLVLVFPVYSCFLRSMELVNYYIFKNRKFYSDDYTVVNSDKAVAETES
jgi:hypothetical protein